MGCAGAVIVGGWPMSRKLIHADPRSMPWRTTRREITLGSPFFPGTMNFFLLCIVMFFCEVRCIRRTTPWLSTQTSRDVTGPIGPPSLSAFSPDR